MGRERIARARHRSCFCPCDRFAPPEEIGDSSDRNMLTFSLLAGLCSAAVVDVAMLPSADDASVGLAASGIGVLSAEGMRWTLCNACLSCTSENSSNGSRLVRIVPENRTGSWGMIERRVRRSCSLIFEMSTPSIIILPARACKNRNNASESVDLPVVAVSYVGD